MSRPRLNIRGRRWRRAVAVAALAVTLFGVGSQSVATVSRYHVLPGIDGGPSQETSTTQPEEPTTTSDPSTEPADPDPGSGQTIEPGTPEPTPPPIETPSNGNPDAKPKQPKGHDKSDRDNSSQTDQSNETQIPLPTDGEFDPAQTSTPRKVLTIRKRQTLVTADTDLAITASVDRLQIPIGGPATLQVSVSNSSLTASSGAKVTVTLPSSIIFAPDSPMPSGFDSSNGIATLGPITPGGTATLSIPLRGYQAGLTPISVRVDPTEGSDLTPANNRATAPITVKPTADMSVYGSFVSPSAEVGEPFTAKVTIINRGPDEAQAAAIAVSVPSGLKISSGTPTKGTWAGGSANSWALPSLRDGTSATLKLDGTVTAPGDSTLTASLASVTRIDPDSNGDTDAASIHGLSSDLSLLGEITVPPAHLGDTITLKETLTNQGPDPTNPGEVIVTLPKGMTLVKGNSFTGTWNPNELRWSTPGLAVGQSSSINVNAKVMSPGTLEPQAQIVKDRRFDPAKANNVAITAVRVPQAELSLNASPPGGQVDTGTSGTVHVELANHGPDPATGVEVLIDPSSGARTVRGDSRTGSFDAGSNTWKVASIASGDTVSLDVDVTTDNPGVSPVNASITARDQVDTDPSDDSDSARVIFALPGTIAPPDTGATDAGPTTPTDGLVATAADAGAKDKPTALDPLKEPVKTIGAAAAGLALVAASGAAAGAAGAASAGGAAGAGGAGGASGSNSSSGGGGQESGGDSESKIEFRTSAAGHDNVAGGDRSITWRTPGHAALDAASVAAPLALAPRSTLLAGLAVDGAHIRAMFGSVWIVGIFSSLGVGIYAAASTNGVVTAPSGFWVLLILALGIIDAAWGAAALFTFTLSLMAWGTGIASLPDARFMIAISILWISVSLIVSKIRTYRRNAGEREDSLHFNWVRAGDLVIAPLLAYWLAGTLAGLIPALSGKEVPWITGHLEAIRVVAAGAMFLRVLLEIVAAQWYPKRMAITCPDALPSQGKRYSLPSLVGRCAVFAFIGVAFLGNCWQLWVATAIYGAAEAISIFKQSFPNLERLYPFLPRDLVKMLFLLFASQTVLRLLKGNISDIHELLRWGFMLALIPTLVLKFLEALIRSGNFNTNWLTRLGGVGVAMSFAVIAL